MEYGIFLGILLFFTIYLFINIYIGKNLKQYLKLMGFKIKKDKLYWTVFMLLAFSYLLARALNPIMPKQIDIALTNIGAYYLAIMMYSIITILILKLLYLLFKRKLANRRGRIRVVRLFGTLGVAIISVTTVYGAINARVSDTVEYRVHLDKKGPAEGLKVVFVSDIHLGNIVGNRRLESLITEINAESPDIVLLGGDIVDEDVEYFIEEKMVDRFERIESRYGIYGVLGNHEYIGGSEERFEEILADSQIEILKDEQVEVAGIIVAGRDDLSGERFTGKARASVEEILKGVDREKAIIMMDHQPTKSGEAEDLGVDMLLSGHTHRGQLFPGSLITNAIYETDWGIEKYGDMYTLVSSGYGTWGPPIKTGSDSEIVVIDIKFKQR